ncbi:response regulator transcription factor [Rossellomorea marisflavi]|uniref:response regulator transcription factor n=1 Tax=Rossellomorea marisflavi TaxID=189381 RepID=UPI00064FA9AB|nr:response regulator transcription factor [Rossellomorea marisflavi]KMK99288.1 transcriptional regulator [Rossellomorea marisflavi]QHA37906.1 response regulator [Rossellomorea marisflavi]
MKTIQIVEDEITISRVLKAYLAKSGFDVVQSYSGREAMKDYTNVQPDLVLLDVMLPDGDGWSVLESIRTLAPTPVIMLTALGDVDYRLKGLTSGADDYIAKPFIGDEVVARVQAVLRRSGPVYDTGSVRLYGDLKINRQSHTVHLKGEEITLTPRDLSVFLFLADHPNQTFTREQLIDRVWGMDYEGSDRAVDLAVKRIRKSLEEWPKEQGEIRTLRGLGYQFSVHQG